MDNKLKRILDERGIKYSWLAREVGVSRNTITNIFKGSTPGIDLAYAIAKKLDLSVYDIWPQ